MAKVTFEFDDIEDRDDVNAVVNRHKLVCVINELDELYRKIYNGKIYNPEDCIYLKADGCKATDEDYKQASLEGKFLSGGKYYLRQEYVEQELDRILYDVKQFLY